MEVQNMDNKQLEERLNLLKESYERLRDQMDVEGILNQLEEAPPILEKKNKGTRWQRVTVWAVSIASIFIITILGASYTKKEANVGSEQVETNIVIEQFLERLKEEYPKEREKRRQLLDLTEAEFSKIGFIQTADSLYKFYTSPNNNLLGTRVNNGDTLQSRVNDILYSLYLPSQMIEEIKRNQITLTEEETANFFNSYSMKIKGLQDFFNNKRDVSLEQTKVLENEWLYREQEKIRYKVEENEEYSNLIHSIAPSASGYFKMLEKEPFTYAGELIYSLDESVSIMFEFENTLYESSDSYQDKSKMKIYYTEIFHAIVKGTKDQSIFEKDGSVKLEYRELWKEMVKETSSSPVNYLLAPIVQEFEASDWIRSTSWEDLDYNDIDDALHLAINGDLGQFIENTP